MSADDDLRDHHAERAIISIAMMGRTAEFLSLPPGAFDHWISNSIAHALRTVLSKGAPSDAAVVSRAIMATEGTGARGHEITVALANMVTMHTVGEAAPYYAERLLNLYVARTFSQNMHGFIRKMNYAAVNDDPIVAKRAFNEAREAIDEAEAGVSVDGPEVLSAQDFMELPRTDYDWLVPDLFERTDRLILTGLEGTGKALCVSTPIPTPNGWSTMGSLVVGDEVFAPDGSITRIVATTDVMHDRPCYRVTFSDGAEIVADANHLWLTETLRARETAAAQARRSPTLRLRGTDQRHKIKHRPAVVTTEHIAGTLLARNGHTVNHSVATCEPIQGASRELPIDPYTLGVWLGDGTAGSGGLTLNRNDAPFVEARFPYDYHRVPSGERPGCVTTRVDGLYRGLRLTGLLGNKHIPEDYLRAAVAQRLALLQGLMDTDGTVIDGSGRGRGTGAAVCEIDLCDQKLANGVLDLLRGLGIKCTQRGRPAVLNGVEVGTRWRVLFQADLPVFSLPRKAERLQPLRTRRAKLRYITAVEPVESVPVRCIQVDREDGMFLIGEHYIPTHNSMLLAQFACTVGAGVHPFTGDPLPDRAYTAMIVDCENSPRQIQRRLLGMTAQVDKLRVKNGMAPVDWSSVVKIVSRPEGVAITDTREYARLDHQIDRVNPDLVVIGPLYKMSKVDYRDEQAAKEVTDALDALRVRHQFVLITEAHTGHAQDNSGQRSSRPLGSSLFLRWPEFGLGLIPAEGFESEEHPSTVNVRRWRGSREERNWPFQLTHGKTLPWEPSDFYRRTAGEWGP